jgi:hypothetical protein
MVHEMKWFEQLEFVPTRFLFSNPETEILQYNSYAIVVQKIAKLMENSHVARTCIVRLQVLVPLAFLLFHGLLRLERSSKLHRRKVLIANNVGPC